MIILVSGEGPSDIGRVEGERFTPGAMSRLIDQLALPIWGYSVLDTDTLHFLSKTALKEACKERKKSATFGGLKRGKGTAEFHKNAQVLAHKAQELADEQQCAVACILFRDCDGVRASSRTRWQEKWESMKTGFQAQGFDLGIPMIPNPKSESWILCALQEPPYQQCSQLETLPGNDRAEGAPKDLLAQELLRQGLGDRSTANLNSLIEAGTIDALQINMPSYNAFRERFEAVLTRMLTLPQGE